MSYIYTTKNYAAEMRNFMSTVAASGRDGSAFAPGKTLAELSNKCRSVLRSLTNGSPSQTNLVRQPIPAKPARRSKL
ncbi:MAG: hypothetical protein SFV17_14760 [Candidatus Obscuribacter sp.]|nr:hypothetical protein [Candidatus Melainabacteria bacterium]MDX1987946.1 hypothetical protein [Candidatus Obscuribacter sp.]